MLLPKHVCIDSFTTTTPFLGQPCALQNLSKCLNNTLHTLNIPYKVNKKLHPPILLHPGEQKICLTSGDSIANFLENAIFLVGKSI